VRAVPLVVLVACGAAPAAPSPTAPPPLAAVPADPPAADPPAADPPPPAPPPAPSGMASALVAEHNRHRKEHCAPPLTWSPELAAHAQRWAEHLRDHRCAFEHSHGKYGENLAEGTAGLLDPGAVVDMWYRESSAYDYKSGRFSMGTGHFTQLVWVDTARLGCGVATCRGDEPLDIWVCNYDPPGNVEGEFKRNVRPRGCR
jgi:uncharacterized protein YkwD